VIQFRCRKCGALYRVADDQVGQKARCQWCGHKQTVPDPSAPPPDTVEFRCSKCDILLGISAAYAGQQVQCNQCGAVLVVPEADADAPRRIPGPPKPPAAEAPAPAPPPAGAGEIVEFRCQFCGHPFRVSSELAGQKGKCKSCGAVNVVPSGPRK